MPTYEYECRTCGRRFEKQQSINDPPLSECPKCGGEVRRLISGGSGFIMKGGQGRLGRNGTGCSFEAGGTTCCGRDRRCDKPGCGGDGE